MSSISKSENEFPVQSYTSQPDVERCEDLSTPQEDKEVVYRNRLPNCVDECLENECNDDQYMSDPKIDALAPIGKINNDRFARHLNHLYEDNESNFDLYSTCFIDGVDGVSSCDDSDFSSHAENFHEDKMGNGFKVYTNTLYDEDCDDDQPIFCQDVQKGSLHGIINPLFEKHMECSDLVEDEFNDDTLSYCCEKSDFSSFVCDRECSDNVAFDDEMLDEVFL